jgi:hypothetical protein
MVRMQKRMGTLNRGGTRTPRPRRWVRFGLPLAGALTGLLVSASLAQATFHEMSIREVYPGGSDNASYVELQMWAPGQEFVGGRHLVAYNSNGSVNRDFSFAAGVGNGANQATILVADTNYASVFPGGPAADASDASLNLSPGGGAVCWTEGSPPDCVAWGNFTGPLPAHVPALLVGNPASPGGVSAGKALQRTIAPVCATLLEPADDSDDSATDFSEQVPNPRSNTSSIAEHDCPPPPDTTPPIATIDSHPLDPSPGGSASFKYHSNEAGSTFECSLSTGGADSFSTCAASGRTYTNLVDGNYTFKVRATDKASNLGLPAAFAWKVDNSLADVDPPETTLTSHPPNPSESPSASFAYEADEPGSSFECKLDADAFAACPASGVAYTGLANGSHAFQVRAKDPSGNVDPTPAGYTFDVVVAAGPVIPPPIVPPPTQIFSAPPASPPETKITRSPSGRTRDRTPTVGFRSSSAGARFECSVDRAPFIACHSPFTAKRLGFGRHAIRIRAIADGTPDATPAEARFKVIRAARKPKRAHASTFHLIQVREVYPGSAAGPQAEFVELQMFESGQQFVAGHVLRVYDSGGALAKANVLGSDAASGANQRTVLLATAEAEAQFGVQADAALAPSGQLDPAGGAVCWESLDCVSWGNFGATTPSPSGSPVDPLGIPDGMSLRRTIARQCPTLLEEADDSNDSAADFADAFPAPQPNSAPPSEHTCSGQVAAGDGGQEGGPTGAGEQRPQTRIRRGPPHRTGDRTPTFRFSSSLAGSIFLCKLDGRSFRRCHSPFTLTRLSLGRHVLKVKASDPGGATDSTPATYSFKVLETVGTKRR